MFSVKNLSIGHRDKIILENIHFEIDAPKFVALIGRNGSGKSTLLRTLSGYLLPKTGLISWNGTNIHAWTAKEKAHYISIVNTEKTFGGNWKVDEWISIGRYPYTHFFGILSEKDKIIVHTTIQWLGIENLRTQFIHQLSDGEKQKVFLARALVQNTPLLLLDEPTAHLDFIARREIFILLKKICFEMNKIIIIATHEIDLAKEYTDIALMMPTDGKFFTDISKNILLRS